MSHVCRLVALLSLFYDARVGAQAPRLVVGEDRSVAIEPSGRVIIEPHLAAHPSDPTHLVAVGWVFPEGSAGGRDGAEQSCAIFVSRDAGRDWTRRDLSNQSCQDPWLSLTARGAILTAMGQHHTLPDSVDQLLAFFSSDGGVSWSGTPQGMGSGHDGPRSIADDRGTVYVTSGQNWSAGPGKSRVSILVGRSRPDRAHIETMHRLLPSNLNLLPDGLALLSDGTLVVSFDDFGRKVRGNWLRAGALRSRRAWAMTSSDGGLTFSVPLFVAEGCYDRPTALAADVSSGPHRDRLYFACASSDHLAILVNHSADRGEEWTTLTPIEAPATKAGSRREPQLAVNAAGVVAVAWMDRRDDPSGRCYSPYVAGSWDGGRTFSIPTRVASEISCPDTSRLGFVGTRWPTGGDYFGLVAAADGRFHLVWSDARDGRFELRSATIFAESAPQG